jgi:hypothetical protein
MLIRSDESGDEVVADSDGLFITIVMEMLRSSTKKDAEPRRGRDHVRIAGGGGPV